MSDHPEEHSPEDRYDAQGLIDLYSRMRRRGALLVWGALLLAVLLVILVSITQPAPVPVLTPEGTESIFLFVGIL